MAYQPTASTPKCRFPGCKNPQEFPDGSSEHCIDHSLSLYFYWRPLAEFGQYMNEEGDR